MTRRAAALLAGTAFFVIAVCLAWTAQGKWFLRVPFSVFFWLTPCLWYYGLTGRSGFAAYAEMEKRHERHRVTPTSLARAAAWVLLFVGLLLLFLWLLLFW